MDPSRDLSARLQDVLRAAESQSGTEFGSDLRDALNRLAEHPDVHAGRLQVAQALPGLNNPIGAGLLAVWIGAGVEHGLPPEPTALPILTSLLKWCRTLPDEVEVGDDEEQALNINEDVVAGVERLGQGLVAHLCRSESVRQQLAGDHNVISELERVASVPGPMWVLEILQKCSGRLLVLHVEQRVGARVTYENISNCFHLFTLLQAALAEVMPGSQAVDPATLMAAQGEDMPAADSDAAWWHYGPGTASQADIGASIWGEGSPGAIPAIDGEQVLLLWPPLLAGRSWSTGFFAPVIKSALPAVTLVEQLTDAEVTAWCNRLQLPPPGAVLRPDARLPASTTPSRPWWRFW